MLYVCSSHRSSAVSSAVLHNRSFPSPGSSWRSTSPSSTTNAPSVLLDRLSISPAFLSDASLSTDCRCAWLQDGPFLLLCLLRTAHLQDACSLSPSPASSSATTLHSPFLRCYMDHAVQDGHDSLQFLLDGVSRSCVRLPLRGPPQKPTLRTAPGRSGTSGSLRPWTLAPWTGRSGLQSLRQGWFSGLPDHTRKYGQVFDFSALFGQMLRQLLVSRLFSRSRQC